MYSMLSRIQASYHQGYVALFGETSGRQCSCIALFSISFSYLKTVCRWEKRDLDMNLYFGDKLYKTLHTSLFLGAEDLPQNFVVFDNVLAQVNLVHNNFGMLYSANHESRNNLVNCFTSHMEMSQGSILFISGLCIAIIPTRSFESIFVFDSHSRNNAGTHDPNGFAILMKFHTFENVADYIVSCYSSEHGIQFEVQFVKIQFSEQLTASLKARLVRHLRSQFSDFDNNRRVNSTCDVILRKHKILSHSSTMSKPAKAVKINFKQNNCKEEEHCLANFLKAVAQGPFYICCSCNRCLYRSNVIFFKPGKYNLNFLAGVLVNRVVSYDNNFYVCKTCDLKMKKSQVPCQSVCNNLHLDIVPEEIKSLNRLEIFLICKMLLFKKIVIMPKGQSPKLQGAVVNIPVDVNETFSKLPSCDNIFLVKLKKKLSFKGHVFFEPVNPEKVKRALLKLKEVNHLYADVNIDTSVIPSHLVSFNENSTDEDELSDNIDFVVSSEVDENKKDPLESHRSDGNETLVVNNNIVHEIAPGEGKQVESLLNSNCEYLSFPHLFSSGKFGMVQNRESKLPVSRYFNQRLLNYTHRFSSNADYIFYAQSVLQQIQFQNQISIAMRKVSGNLNASMFRHYKESVDNLVRNDQGFLFMSKIRGTPAYWKRFQSEVLAMVKQLGCPSFFLTLSCADLKWNDLVEVILKSRNLQMAAEEIAGMDYFTRCKFLNDNPVTVVRHFQ